MERQGDEGPRWRRRRPRGVDLNARAIGALDRELVTIRGDVDSLVVELDASIKEADAFIEDMEVEKAGAGK